MQQRARPIAAVRLTSAPRAAPLPAPPNTNARASPRIPHSLSPFLELSLCARTPEQSRHGQAPATEVFPLFRASLLSTSTTSSSALRRRTRSTPSRPLLAVVPRVHRSRDRPWMPCTRSGGHGASPAVIRPSSGAVRCAGARAALVRRRRRPPLAGAEKTGRLPCLVSEEEESFRRCTFSLRMTGGPGWVMGPT
jgi:hypothetical protein